MIAYTDLTQTEIEQLSPEEFSYYLAHGYLENLEEAEYQHLLRHLVEYDD